MNKIKARIYAEALNSLFVNFFRNLKASEKSLAAEMGFTLPQIFVLMTVDSKNGCKMSGLAKGLSLNFGTATGIVDRLVRDGYIERQRDEEDRRVVWVSLTNKGKKIIKEAHKRRKEKIATLLEKFSEEDFKTLLSIFQRVGPLIIADLSGNKED